MVQSNAPGEIYQLHILLLQINPPIWRRLHVRSDSSIATLHELLQIAFDWSDFHLHRFVIRGKEYGLSRIGGSTFRTDAKKALLSQFHFRVNERFLYEYDFGDLWQHQIRFEGIEPVREKKLYPVCHRKDRSNSDREQHDAQRRITQLELLFECWNVSSPHAETEAVS